MRELARSRASLPRALDLQFPTSMTPNKVLIFRAPAPPLAGQRRMRARPAEVIPLHAHRQGREGSATNALFAIATILVWAGAIVLGLVTLRSGGGWSGDRLPVWPWPLW